MYIASSVKIHGFIFCESNIKYAVLLHWIKYISTIKKQEIICISCFVESRGVEPLSKHRYH